jgi:hypothetical protein
MRDHVPAPTRRAATATAPLAVRLALAALVAACGGGDAEVARGPGLPVAELSVAERAAAYDAALHAGFDVAPGLTLLVAPEHLPRTAGLAGGPPVAPALVAALRARGIVQGTCAAPPPPEGEVPRCAAAAPGYLLRLSEPYGVAGDTIQLYVDAERYALPGATPSPPFHFETAYQLVGRGDTWRVLREGRVPPEARTRSR